MFRFSEWVSIRESSEAVVSGQGIRDMQRAMRDMAGRGAPNQWNDYGFSKMDYGTYHDLEARGWMDSEAVPVSAVRKMLQVLGRYQNTQVRNYRAISAAVQRDMMGGSASPPSADKVVVFDSQPRSYGKIKVHIPHGLDRSSTILVNRALDAALESEGVGKEPNRFSGRLEYPRFKKLSQDKSSLHSYWIHPSVIGPVMEILKSKGMKVEYESGSASAPAQEPTRTPESPKSSTPDVEIIGKEKNQYGNKVAVRFNYERSKGLFQKMKDSGLAPRGISYAGDGKFLINVDDRDLFDAVVSKASEMGLDVSPLQELSGSLGTSTGSDVSKKDGVIRFSDAEGESITIKTDVRSLSPDRRDFVRETIQYNFPEYEYDRTGYFYKVSGTYKQYVAFGRLLGRFGYPVDELRKIIKDKLDSGRLSKTEWEGRYDKDKEFQDSIDDKVPDSMIDLYDEQRFGVAFLYGRDSAILGDETGFGKCLLPESWIQTSEGLMSIEEIWNSFADNCVVNENGEEWAKPSSEIYVHSMDSNKKIIKSRVVGLYREKIDSWAKEIKTSNGRTIRSTIPHKFYTGEGWKHNVVQGDLICSSPNLPPLQQNDFKDEDLTTILAWQISEGWESNKRATVRIFQKDKSVLEKIQKLLAKKNIKSRIYERETSLGLVVNSKEYKNMLESMGYEWGKKSASKCIPEFIMNSSNDIVKLFIKSFFDAECYVNPRCRQLELSTASEKMAKQIQALLWRFGIFCICHEHMKMATNGSRILRKYQTIYVCGSSIEKFFTEIGLDYEYKVSSFFNISTRPNPNKEGKPAHRILGPFFDKYKIPVRLLGVPSRSFVTGERMATNKLIGTILDSMKRLKSGDVLQDYLGIKKSKWTQKTLSAINSVKKDDLENAIHDLKTMLESDLYYERVLSVTRVRYKGYVYDLCVEGTQNYIANGLICHNTIQLVTAAALRMQASGKPTLIITLKATQKQFADEIVRVMGEKERSQISLDPTSPRKWTVIRYSDFSGGKDERNRKVQEHVESLKRAGFGIAILDELHKVKHGKSQRSQNIASVVDTIPTRWGASATVSSNKPMDVKNQLLMMGHPLGRVKEKKFKKDFAGMVPDGYKGRFKKSDKDEDEIRAAERLNKWLNLSGVYVRREKGEIREMPDLSVGSDKTNIDRNRFQSLYSTKVQSYKDPTLPVSQLIAARESIAQLKTDETARKVIEIVAAGRGKPPAASKVVVFTNFIESGRQLVDKISKGLEGMDSSYSVITYLSDTSKKEREKVKKRFTDDPNIKVLVMSMKMGGTGIDFPNAAQHMVINDFDWTPESAEQSEGRIYRINTDHPVKIRYVIGDGLDAELFDKVQRKREIAAIIQKYRREYHDSESSPEALKKIVDAQKEMKKLDDDMTKIVAANLPGAEEAMKESFSSYLRRLSKISEALHPTE
jgi:intein/homing endonuclease/superfamily II DNA or RNA helicase